MNFPEIELSRNWEASEDIDNTRKRLLKECLSAYFRQEYGLTAIVLSTMWERLLGEKSNHRDPTIGNNKDKMIHALVQANPEANEYQERSLNRVYVSSHRQSDVGNEIPARHLYCHSKIIEYPSQKAALNSILVTDYLLKIQPVPRKQT